mgnify:CR=1 FL=1
MLENYQSPWMDEELVIMRDAVRKFLDKEFVPHSEKWDKQGFVDRDAWYKAGDAGILCASISEEWGGGGVTASRQRSRRSSRRRRARR